MLKSTPAERARSRYIVILFTDGTPDPLCSADTTPCGPMSCMPHSHCVPTTILNASSKQQEQYSCDPDYLVCTVPKKNWASAFNPPVDPSLYPGLLAGANYNTTPQLAHRRDRDDGAAEAVSRRLDSSSTPTCSSPLAALSNPLAVPFDLDRPAAEALLQAMAAAGNGTFQEFTSNTDINFLNINFSSIQVNNDVVVTYAVEPRTRSRPGTRISTDTDADGLSDDQESSLGTCAALARRPARRRGTPTATATATSSRCSTRTSGFDPLDPTKPHRQVRQSGGRHGRRWSDGLRGGVPQDRSLSPDTDGDLTLDTQRCAPV